MKISNCITSSVIWVSCPFSSQNRDGESATLCWIPWPLTTLTWLKACLRVLSCVRSGYFCGHPKNYKVDYFTVTALLRLQPEWLSNRWPRMPKVGLWKCCQCCSGVQLNWNRSGIVGSCLAMSWASAVSASSMQATLMKVISSSWSPIFVSALTAW